MKRCTLRIFHVALALVALVPAIKAGPIVNRTFVGVLPATITDSLPNQDTALEEAFTLSAVSNLTITTTSYAVGGFEPNLLLFNSLGKFVSAGIPFGVKDPTTGIVGDMRLTANNLAAGTYTLALTDFLLNQSLTATNLSDGFTVNFGSGSGFIDVNGNQRTGVFAVTINAASAAAVPEPTTLWLAMPFLVGLGMVARKRLQS